MHNKTKIVLATYMRCNNDPVVNDTIKLLKQKDYINYEITPLKIRQEYSDKICKPITALLSTVYDEDKFNKLVNDLKEHNDLNVCRKFIKTAGKKHTMDVIIHGVLSVLIRTCRMITCLPYKHKERDITYFVSFIEEFFNENFSIVYLNKEVSLLATLFSTIHCYITVDQKHLISIANRFIHEGPLDCNWIRPNGQTENEYNIKMVARILNCSYNRAEIIYNSERVIVSS